MWKGWFFNMTHLSCSVANCANNLHHCCCLSSIKVDGSNAVNSSETCCESFLPKQGGNNLTMHQNEDLCISCSAKNCAFNCNGECEADCIGISGYGAESSTGTVCASFITNDLI